MIRVKFGGRDLNIVPLGNHEFHKNSYMYKRNYIYENGQHTCLWLLLTPATPHYICNANNQQAWLPLQCVSKTSHYFAILFFSEHNHFGINVDQDQQFWMARAVKWHFRKLWIQYNHTLFTGKLSRSEGMKDNAVKTLHVSAGQKSHCVLDQWVTNTSAFIGSTMPLF